MSRPRVVALSKLFQPEGRRAEAIEVIEDLLSKIPKLSMV